MSQENSAQGNELVGQQVSTTGAMLQIAQLAYQLLMALSAFAERHRDDGAAFLDATLDITLKTVPFLVAVFGKAALVVEQNGRYFASTFAQWVDLKTVLHAQIERIEKLLDSRTSKYGRYKLGFEIAKYSKRAICILASPAAFKRNWNDIAEGVAFNSTIVAWLAPLTVVYLQGIQYSLAAVTKFLWIVSASSMNVSQTTAGLYYTQLASFITYTVALPQTVMIELGYPDSTARRWKSLAASKVISLVEKVYRILAERYIAKILALFGLRVPHIVFPTFSADELPSPADATVVTTNSTISHQLPPTQSTDISTNFADWINGYQPWHHISEISHWIVPPKHMAVILIRSNAAGSTGDLVTKAAQAAEWAVELGVSILTIYEKSGLLVAEHNAIGLSANRRLQNNGNSSFCLRIYSPNVPLVTNFTADGVSIEQPWEPDQAPPQHSGLLIILLRETEAYSGLFELTQNIASEIIRRRVLASQVSSEYIQGALTNRLIGIPSSPDLVVSDCSDTQRFPLYTLKNSMVLCHDGHSFERKVTQGLINYSSAKRDNLQTFDLPGA